MPDAEGLGIEGASEVLNIQFALLSSNLGCVLVMVNFWYTAFSIR